MTTLQIFLIALGLSADAFAVAVCKGLSVQKVTVKHSLIVGVYFGGFQALMPFIGYHIYSLVEDKIGNVDSFIAFVLLSVIGINMIRESFKQEKNEQDASFSFVNMSFLAFATSIDALTTGAVFAIVNVNIFFTVAVIGLTTFVCSVIGFKIGNIFGEKLKSRAELIGGFILIGIAIQILLSM